MSKPILTALAAILAAGCGDSTTPPQAASSETTPVAHQEPEPEQPTETAEPEPPAEEVTEPAPDPASALPDREALLGAWQDSPDVGSGYTGVLLIFADETFIEWEPGGCQRYVSERRGTWSFEGTTLLLTEQKRVEVLRGRPVRDGDTCHWENERTRNVDVTPPRLRDLPLSACDDEQRASGAGQCAQFGGTPRWRIMDADTAQRELVPELGLEGE